MIFDTNNYYDDVQVGESPYPLGLEGALMHVYENECNYNAMMKAVGISELRYYKDTGKSLFVHEAGAFSAFIEKAKSFFKKVIEKIKQSFHKFAATLNQYFMKDKEFVKKYEKELTRKNLTDFEFEGYKFDHVEDAKSAALGNALDDLKDAELSDTEKQDFYKSSKSYSDKDFDSTNREKTDEVIYGAMYTTITGKNDTVDGSDFREELHEYLYGDKETLDKIQIRQQLSYIRETRKDVKDVEKQQHKIIKSIDGYIKKLDNFANSVNKKDATYKGTINQSISSDRGGTVIKDDKITDADKNYLTKSIDFTIASMKTSSNAVTIAFGMIVQAVKDRNRQAKAICVKAIGYKHEAASYYNYSESSVDDLFAGVTIR